MIFEYNINKFPDAPNNNNNNNINLIIQKIKHMLPEYIFDAVQVENNPITIPEIKTLIDGITIGGHKISDVQQIINLNTSWKYIIEGLRDNTFNLNQEYSNRLHGYLGKEEALEWGVFRDGSISIAGAKRYKCPKSSMLKAIYNSEIEWVMNSVSPIENAMKYFLWGCLNQFYWDCNKRLSRLMAIGILMSSGYGVLNTPAKHVPEFNKLMTEFYDTQNGDKILTFLSETSLKRIEKQMDSER